VLVISLLSGARDDMKMKSAKTDPINMKPLFFPNQIFAIGYSTHSIENFTKLLQAHDIKMVVDVRTIPKSRHCPQYNKEELKHYLKTAKISYRHMKELGGLRHTSKDSINTGWENASFRGFADYMQTLEFEAGLEKLEELAHKKLCVLMCAEGNPWRCHRSLIADALTLKKWKVFHIQSKKTIKLHKRTSFLKVKNGKITYPHT
jgi:uncharacterized protein (DUF488 family)